MTGKLSRSILSILNLIGFLGVVIINALAVILPINNKTTQQLSDQYPNLFVPAGLTFSIWGVIYLLLGIFTIYNLISAFKKDSRTSFPDKIGILFFLSCVANIAWIFAWQYEIVPLSLLIMLLLLACLLAIYLKLGIGKKGPAKKEQYLVHLPFSVYLGWITIATIANVTALLVQLNWNGFGINNQVWTVIVILVGIAITLAILGRRQDIFYALVVDWAILGIFLKRTDPSFPPAQAVVIVTIAGIALISAGILVQLFRKRVYSVGAR
jgi:hypothetical protein